MLAAHQWQRSSCHCEGKRLNLSIFRLLASAWRCPCLKNQSGPGSVRFGYGLGVERFDRFRFSVPAVPLQKGFFCVSVHF